MRPLHLIAIAAIVAPSIAEARETGDLRGQVQDTDGIAVPGATVRISGENLGGTRETVTGEDGEFRFNDLGPGEYQVDIEWKGRPRVTAIVEVALDRVTFAPLKIDLSEQVETLVVRGIRPTVDTTSSSIGTTMSQAYLQELPVGRSYQDVIATLPGVSGRVDTSGGGSGNGNPSVRGEGQYGNNYTVDGVMTRDPATNTYGANVNFDAIEEITVYTDGAPAEYGQFTGMAANVVTKDGGDEHFGSAAVFYGQHAFFDKEYDIFNPDEARDMPTTKARFRSPTLNLTAGGPIIPEKLWYFAAADVNYGWSVAEGLDTDRAQEVYGAQGWGKLTWFVNPAWTVRFQSSYDWANSPATDAGLLVEKEATSDRRDGSLIQNLRATFNPTANTGIEFKAGYLQTYINSVPTSGDAATASALDSQGRLLYNASQFDFNRRVRVGGGLSVTQFLEDALGTHRIKAGAEYWRLRALREVQNTGETEIEWIDADGNPTGEMTSVGTQWQADPSNGYDCVQPDYSDCGVVQYSINAGELGTNVHTLFGYIQDEWRPVKQLTLNLGFRIDAERGINDAGEGPMTMIPGEFGLPPEEQFVGELKSRVMPAPRLGFSLDPWADGKTRIFGTYGWYYDLAGGDFWEWANTRSSAGFVRYARDPNGEMQWTNTQDPAGSPLIYDHALQVPRMDKVIVGGERELIPNLSVSLRGILSRTQGLTEDVDTDLDYWYIVNPAVKYRMYRALEAAVEKEYADNWQLLASYTLSEAYGTSPGQFELAAGSDYGSNGNNVGVFLDDVGERDARQFYYDNGLGWILEGFKGTGRYSVTDPDYVDTAGYEGYLPYHSFHMVKVNGSYRLPFGTLFGVVYEFDSGHAWQKRTYIPFYGFDGMAEGRGSRFMPAAHYVDVRIAHKFELAKETSLEATVDVFNLPGFAQAITYFDNEAPGFGSTMARQAPRSIRVGAKYRW